MTTIDDIIKSIGAEHSASVKAEIAAYGDFAKTTWTQANSVNALLALADAYHDALTTIDSDPDAKQDELITAAQEAFKLRANRLANPSAFRQYLEDGKHFPDKKPRIAKSETRSRSTSPATEY